MLTAERRQRILDLLEREGKLVAAHLAEQFQLSHDTIRRDLRDLADEGLIRKVHGGALPVTPNVPAFAARERTHGQAKSGIARVAAKIVKSGSVVVMDSGTTNLEIARFFPEDLLGTIVTNNVPLAVALSSHRRLEVILLGGTLMKDAQGTIGAIAIEALGRLHADVCFLGICSLHAEAGVTCFDFEEAQVKRAMVECSAEVVAVAIPEKLGTISPHAVCRAAEVTQLVTESSVPSAKLEPFRRLGVSIVQ
jgi:DeoR/GlpR family transcriptional regulator of sugar metabolism